MMTAKPPTSAFVAGLDSRFILCERGALPDARTERPSEEYLSASVIYGRGCTR